MSITINHETNDISATSGSITIDGGSTIPSGLIVMWSGTEANIPSGFVLCDGNNGTPNLTDKFILGRSAGTNTNSTGGSNTVTLASGNLPSHTHDSGNFATGGAGDHSHNFNTNTGNVGNHTHSYTQAGSNHTHSHYRVAYGSPQNYTNQNPIYFGNLSTSRAYNQRIAMKSNNTGSAGAGGGTNTNTGGSGSHSHNFNANTGNSGNHTHNVSGNTGSTGSGTAVNITPVYFTLAFIMKS